MPIWVYILSAFVLVIAILIFELGSEIFEKDKHFILMIGGFLVLYVLIVAVILIFNKHNPADSGWIEANQNSSAPPALQINTTQP